MPEILNLIGALAAVATAVGVIIAAVQLRMAKQQSITTFEDQVAGQYREIARRLPVAALLGESLSESEQCKALPDFYHYFDLSNEQAYLYQRKRISGATWKEWSEGISQNLARPAFAAAWAEVHHRAPHSFNELRAHLSQSGLSITKSTTRPSPTATTSAR